MAGHGTGT